MKVSHDTITIATPGRGFFDVTDRVREVVAARGVRTGLCSVFVRHTSASLLIQENADPRVLRDLERWLDRIAPESADYSHDDEGPDDMPGHLKSSVTRASESIPIIDGRLALGTWQGIYLAEHRRAPHPRQLVVTVLGT
jgi:secondary thiamine-phosphate synthase enzyme